MMVRKHIYYTGSVQGVGFRYTTARIAADYDITGYVKNLPDGRVEVIAQGTTLQVNAFINQLADAMARYIRDTNIKIEPYSGAFKKFNISF